MRSDQLFATPCYCDTLDVALRIVCKATTASEKTSALDRPNDSRCDELPKVSNRNSAQTSVSRLGTGLQRGPSSSSRRSVIRDENHNDYHCAAATAISSCHGECLSLPCCTVGRTKTYVTQEPLSSQGPVLAKWRLPGAEIVMQKMRLTSR